ncbi:unnamed protein product, partial [Didymodactylos carnosus]
VGRVASARRGPLPTGVSPLGRGGRHKATRRLRLRPQACAPAVAAPLRGEASDCCSRGSDRAGQGWYWCASRSSNRRARELSAVAGAGWRVSSPLAANTAIFR